MHTSNLWHVPTTTAAPTFQQREKSQSQTKTPLANLTKTFLSLYFSCAFLGSFIWYHPQVKPSPEGVQLYASPWHYLLFFPFCGILDLCTAPRTELEVHPGTIRFCWEAPQTQGAVTSTGVEGFAQACLIVSIHWSWAPPRHTAGMQESPRGCRTLHSSDFPQTNPAGKDIPTGVSPPSPNLLVLFYIILYSVCQVEQGGDSSRRTESSILKQKDR